MDPSSLLTAGGTVLTGFGQVLAKKFGEAWTHAKWITAESEYRQRLVRELGRMRLLGAKDPIELTDLFTDVYFLPSVSAHQRYNAEALGAIVDFEQVANLRVAERISAFDVARTAHRLYILGTPGSGKSTFLKHIAIAAAMRSTTLLPVFISMKDWSESNMPFLDFACREFDVCGFPDAAPVISALLESGKALLLLDGLDEVQTIDEMRDRVLKEILLLSRKYPACKVFLTCRTSSNDHIFSSFQYVEMADFSTQQQDIFIGKWFAKNPAKLRAIQHELKQPAASRLRDLGRKPLLLAFLCIVFDQLQEFPRSRSSLYDEAVDVLLADWDATRSIKRETYVIKGVSRKKQLLAQLAYRTFEVEKFVFPALMIESVVTTFLQRAPGADYKDEVEVERLLRSFEYAHGIIVERAAGQFSFSHLSIHEYLTAIGLVNKLTSGISWSELLPWERASQTRWRDVIVHVASIMPEADSLISHLINCASQHTARHETLSRTIHAIDSIADDQVRFSRLCTNPDLFFNPYGGLNAAGNGHFVPSPALRAACVRFLDDVTKDVQAEKVPGKVNISSALLPVWRRAVVLRELFSMPKAIPLLVGRVDASGLFDQSFRVYMGFQELMLDLLSQAMIGRKDILRSNLLRANK